MCWKDLSKGVPFRNHPALQGSYVTGETTGALRTDGQCAPRTNFPTDPRSPMSGSTATSRQFSTLAAFCISLATIGISLERRAFGSSPPPIVERRA